MTELTVVSVASYDIFDIVALCHAALAQDSPNSPEFYINQIMNLASAHMTADQKQELEEYLADKKYLPPAPKIEIAK